MTEQPETTVPTAITPEVAELIALGAAMAASCEEAFQAHHYRAHKLGVAREDMIKAVNIALNIKMAPHNSVVDMAQHYLVGGHDPEQGGCCGGACDCEDEASEAGCCGGDEGCGCK